MQFNRQEMLLLKGLIDKEMAQLVTFQQSKDLDDQFKGNFEDLYEVLKNLRERLEDQLLHEAQE